MLNGWEIVLVLFLVVLVFGAKKLPELARGLGQGIREFKRGTQEGMAEPDEQGQGAQPKRAISE